MKKIPYGGKIATKTLKALNIEVPLEARKVVSSQVKIKKPVKDMFNFFENRNGTLQSDLRNIREEVRCEKMLEETEDYDPFKEVYESVARPWVDNCASPEEREIISQAIFGGQQNFHITSNLYGM